MIGNSGGQDTATVSAENKLNYLLTMFQKCWEAIKGFQFHFARGIVCGEENSKSSEPHQITKILKNVRSRDQFKKYETETRSLRDQNRDRDPENWSRDLHHCTIIHQVKENVENSVQTKKICTLVQLCRKIWKGSKMCRGRKKFENHCSNTTHR